ncbi:M29 family metallopeptidase [Paraburkholderia megapolitana]|uniref:hypothetical protein n=1 Tax=Paraburkholderia megapolitana TaxID=420953 RepID=UPI0038BB853B
MVYQDQSFDPVGAGISIFLSSYLNLRRGDKIMLRVASSDLDAENPLRKLVQIAADLNITLTTETVHESDIFDCSTLVNFDVVVYASRTQSVHKRPILEYIKSERRTTRFYRIFDFSNEIFEQCFSVDQFALESIGSAILSNAKNTRTVRVTSDSGTNLTIKPDRDADWTHSCGMYDGVIPGVFPSGEINTFSQNISGKFIADGSLNMNFPFDDDVRLQGREIMLEIDEGKVRNFQCVDPLLFKMCETLMSIDNGDRVGEIGFGTNEGVHSFVPFRSHINERVAGFHIGCGSPIQRKEYVRWKCPLHVDFISATVKIYFDDALVFANQRWLRTALPTPIAPARADLFADAL